MFGNITTLSKLFFPRWIQQRLIGQWDTQGFKKYFANTGWISLAKAVTLIMSFFTMAFVARYLGPENLGKISYAQSFTAIFSVFATLGIDQILYRELIAHPEKRDELLGTAISAKLFFGIFTLITTTLLSLSISNDPILTWLIGIIALSFIFQPLSTVSLVFKANVQAKYPSYVTLIIALLIPFLKLIVIFSGQGILFFAVIISFEALFNGVANLYLYRVITKQTFSTWRFSSTMFRNLFRDSWPLILVGVSGYLYGRVDQVMLQHFINSSSVGVYDVAVRLTELLGFLPGIIVSSLFPAIINAKKSNVAEYKKRLRSLLMLCMSISIVMASILYILAPQIIHLLFGETFNESVSIVRIYVWSNLGTVATILIYNYLIAENLSRFFLIFTISGALVNIALNLFLIPQHGTIGAAYATCATLLATVTIFILIRRRLISS